MKLYTNYLIKDTKTNILELNQSKQKLSESEEKYRYLFQNNPAYIIIWDLENLNVLEVNNQVIKRYGYTENEWQGMSVLKYRPKSDHELIKKFAEDAIHSDQQVLRRVWTHLTKDGEELLMEISSHKIYYKGHKAILSLGNDITEKEKAALAYRKSEEKFHSLVDHAADAIFMITAEGKIFDVNYAAVKLLQ
jgi:PAS domain S-box-containing protein